MANWTFATGDALTRKAWGKKWWVEGKTMSFFYDNGFVGEGMDNFIVEMPDLEKDQGDVIYFGEVMELTGAGVTGDSAMETSEEAPSIYDDAITLDQVRNAVRTDGKLTEQRASQKGGLRAWAQVLLDRWLAANIDQAIFTALAASPTKVVYGGDATATTDIEAGDYMTLDLVSKCVTYAAKANPVIEGKNVSGKGAFVIVMAPDQMYDVRARDAAFSQAQREALQRGPDNLIFKRSMGVHMDCAMHYHSRVALATTWGSGSNLPGATALFMGIKAGAIAYSAKRSWNEKTFDYANQVGFCVGAIYGVTKAVFNSADNAVVAVRTYRTSN